MQMHLRTGSTSYPPSLPLFLHDPVNSCNAQLATRRALTMTGKQKNMRDEQIRIVPQILHDSLALIVVVAVVVVWVVVAATLT